MLPRRHGSSPRLWGTLPFPCVDCGQLRFIPTPVGNTPNIARGCRHWAVHPHACGEHVDGGTHWGDLRGSSPRLWGTPSQSRCKPSLGRFIPTPVGNTRGLPSRRKTVLVHPHACGEHESDPGGHADNRGSSPRLWGTPLSGFFNPFHKRFIPTPVGNTTPVSRAPVPATVHPHACGEHRLSYCVMG